MDKRIKFFLSLFQVSVAAIAILKILVVFFEEELKNKKDIADVNPWNKDKAIIQKKWYLMDDCVVMLRPARMEDQISRSRHEPVRFYFIEIMNQDESIKFTSRRIYSWDEVIEFVSWFKGLSFTAATKVWKVKKL